MPDTGAPWFIPYADSTDLVRDWPALSEDISEAVADALPLGLGPNVAQGVRTAAYTSSSTSFVTVTDLTVSLTPSSATSKVLVLVQLNWCVSAAGTDALAQVLRDSTVIGSSSGQTTNVWSAISGTSPLGNPIHMSNFMWLDSPNTDLAITYAVQTRSSSSGAHYVNRRAAADDFGGSSTITAIEVAA
jgi:hypothetical protein